VSAEPAPARRGAVRASGRALARLLSGGIVGQAVLLVSSPVLTRLYDEADFAALAVVTGVSATLGAVVTGCWERAVVAVRSDAVARALLVLALACTVVGSLTVGVVTAVGRRELARVLSVPALVDWWWVVPLTVAAIGVQRCTSVALVRASAYGALGTRSAVQGVVQVAVALVLAPLGGPVGLLVGPAVGRAAATVGVVGAARTGREAARARRPRGRSLPGRRALRATWARHGAVAATSSASALVNAVGLQLPVVILAAVAGATSVGLLAVATRLVATPVAVVAEALGHHHDARLGAVLRSGTGAAAPVVQRTLALSGALAALGVAVVALSAPHVVGPLLGQGWDAAVPYVRLTAVVAGAQLVAVPVSRTLVMLGAPGAQLGWDGVRLVATFGTVLVCALADVDPWATVASWAAAAVCSYLALVVLVLVVARRRDARVLSRRG